MAASQLVQRQRRVEPDVQGLELSMDGKLDKAESSGENPCIDFGT